MEKQGMVRRRRIQRAGLLSFFLLLFFPAVYLTAQADGGGEPDSAAGAAGGAETGGPSLEIRLETSPANPMVNSPWAIHVLVNHPRPSEVNVIPPLFPPALVLERVRTETRLIRGEAPAGAEGAAAGPQGGRWTRVEFLFTPVRAGAVKISPFEVTVLDRQASTGELDARFREEPRTARRYEPRFRWLGAPSVPSGRQGELTLELSGWDPRKEVPEGIFRGKAPLNAILEEDPPAAAGDGIYRYAVFIIPLEEQSVVLEARSFAAGGFTLDIPEITIPVLPAGPSGGAAPPASLREEPAPGPVPGPEEGSPLRPFPGYREKVFPLFQTGYARATALVRTLWEAGSRVEALAEIRRNERDSPAGPFFAPLRRGMEEALGLGYTVDERWRPFGIPLALWAVLGFTVISGPVALLVFRPRRGLPRGPFRRRVSRAGALPPDSPETSGTAAGKVTSRRWGGFIVAIAVVMSIGAALIFLEHGLGYISMGNFLIDHLGRSAVLKGTAAYRVPDSKGAVNTVFGEGQPVNLGDYRGDWCYAESPDGQAGWVPRETVITY